MSPTTSSALNEPVRMLRHPGPVDPLRMESLVEDSRRAVRIVLPAGKTLLAGVTEALSTLGIACGTMSLLGGAARKLVYVLARPDESGEKAVVLTSPFETPDATVVAGGGSIGRGADGQPFIHCHALFAGADGAALGGHLLNDRTVMGKDTVAYVWELRDIAVDVLFDPEINVAIFRPTPSKSKMAVSLARSDMTQIESGRTGRIAYTHVRPNEDFVHAVQKVALLQGFRSAFVRGSLGSLTDACLASADGTVRLVRGPAIEVLSVTGEVRSDSEGVPEARLSGAVVDPEGRVFGGRFVSGRNPVCMTFELVLEEWLPDADIHPEKS